MKIRGHNEIYENLSFLPIPQPFDLMCDVFSPHNTTVAECDVAIEQGAFNGTTCFNYRFGTSMIK